MTTIAMTPIGFVRGGRAEPIDDNWDAVEAVIVLDPAQFAPDATAALCDFSHIEVVFYFNRVPGDEIQTGARHPRGQKALWPRLEVDRAKMQDFRQGTRGQGGVRWKSAELRRRFFAPFCWQPAFFLFLRKRRRTSQPPKSGCLQPP